MEEIKKNEFFLCYYNLYTMTGHIDQFHVLLRVQDVQGLEIENVQASNFTYCLKSQALVFVSKKEEKKSPIYRGLIMDGESLLKRFRAQQKKSIQFKTEE